MSRKTILIYAVEASTSPTGICRYVATLATELVPHARIVIAIGPWQEGAYSRLLPPDGGVEMVLLPIANTVGGRYVANIAAMGALVKQLQPDTVHFAYQSSAILAVAGRRGTVLTVHDLYAHTAPEAFGWANRSLNRLVAALGIHLVRRLIVISQATRRVIEQHFPGTGPRIALIYQPVRMPAATDTARHAEQFLMVAGHRRHKNIDLAIEALSTLVRRGRLSSETSLTIVGAEGQDSARLRGIASGCPYRVTFLSSLPEAGLVALYTTSTALLIPSSDEGFCLPAVEAVQLGCRVVCSDIPILREVLADRATYFPLDGADSAGALAEALLAALAAPARDPEPSWFRGEGYAASVLATYGAAS